MNSGESPDSERRTLEQIIDAFYDIEVQGSGGSDEILRDSGFDPTELADRGIQFIANLKSDIRRENARSLKKQFDSFAGRFLKSVSVKDRRVALTEEATVAGVGDFCQVFARRLEKLSDEDLMKLSDEQQLLEAWSAMDSAADESHE